MNHLETGSTTSFAVKAKRILIVEDHPIVREGYMMLISRQPDMEVCAEAADVNEALDAVREHQPDLAVVDITLKKSSGVDLCKRLQEVRPSLRILVVSAHDESLYADRVLRAGARGYIRKDAAIAELIDGIRTVLQGRLCLSDSMTQRILAHSMSPGDHVAISALDSLSDRELQVFQHIGRGLSTQQIATHLHLSVSTIESYREHLKRKMNLRSGTELVRHAVHWVLENS